MTKGKGRLSRELPKIVVEHMMAIAPPLPFPIEDPHPQFVSIPFSDKLTCPICLDIVQQPVYLSCDHTVCTQCCCKHIRQSYFLQCPCCNRHPLTSEAISAPSPLLLSLLNDCSLALRRKQMYSPPHLICLATVTEDIILLILLIIIITRGCNVI